MTYLPDGFKRAAAEAETSAVDESAALDINTEKEDRDVPVRALTDLQRQSADRTAGQLAGAGETVYEDEFGYALLGDGIAVITAYTGESAFVSVPLTLDGYDVVALASGAFGAEVRQVTLHGNLFYIADGALPDGITVSAWQGSYAAAWAQAHGYELLSKTEGIDFFSSLQDDDGGISDYSLVDEGRALNHPEFAISMGKDHDKICEYLYCVNNILGACSLAKRMTRNLRVDTQRLSAIGSKLLSFVLRTQITYIDNRIDGGWMRAFDLSGKEYYGVNRDKDWSPYCIMGGWVMAFIPLIMLGEMEERSIYSIDA